MMLVQKNSPEKNPCQQDKLYKEFLADSWFSWQETEYWELE